MATPADIVVLAAKLTKAEDSPAQDGHPGVPILGRRNDARGAALTSNDGDYGNIAIDDRGRVAVYVDGGLLAPSGPAHSTTVTKTNVAASITSVTLLAANPLRMGATLVNDSTSFCWLCFGTPASSSSWSVPMVAGAFYVLDFAYDEVITGIWVTATGYMRVSEFT